MGTLVTRLGVAFSAFALMATVVNGCGGQPDDDTLRLGYFPNITHAPALVGVENGVFADALGDGVTLETSTFNAGPSAIEAMFADGIDATFIGPNPAINGWAQSDGAALHIVAGSTSGGAALATRPDIETVEDLKGKTIATPQLANTQDVAARHWLGEQGLETGEAGSGDVEVRPTDNSAVVGAFADGAVDGAWLVEPQLSRLLIEQDAHVLLDEAELWPGGQFVTTHLVVRAELLDERPEVVEQLIAAHVEAVDYVNSEPEAAQEAANAHLDSLTGAPLEGDVLAAAFANLEFTVDPIASSLQKSADHAATVGLLDPVDLDGVYELDILNSLLREQGHPEVDDKGLGK